jgi:hypothetical protein
MARIFVSSCRIDGFHAAALIKRLRDESFTVLHSPRNPADGEDHRWRDWYEHGCRAELEMADIFVTVISRAWNCSTWMAHEVGETSRLVKAGKIRCVYFWNPERIKVEACGIVEHLNEPLPDNLDDLILALRAESNKDYGSDSGAI